MQLIDTVRMESKNRSALEVEWRERGMKIG